MHTNPGPPLYEADSKLESVEQLILLSAVAEILGVPVYSVRRAARGGEFPTYRMGKGRTRVRLSEVLAAVKGSRDDVL